MWLAVWGCFAAFVVAFVCWSVVVLMQQKKTWADFARKNNLHCRHGKLMDSVTVTGDLDDRKFALYTGVQKTEDIRGQRFVTVIEFQLGRGMPTGAAIATKEFGPFIDGLIFDRKFVPRIPEWQKDFIVRTRCRKSLKVWLTVERQQILARLLAMKNSTCLFFFDEIEAVLRLETADPLRDTPHLEKVMQRLRADAAALSPTAEEKKIFRQLLAEEKQRLDAGIDEEDDEDEDEEEKTAGQGAETPEPAPAPPVPPQSGEDPA